MNFVNNDGPSEVNYTAGSNQSYTLDFQTMKQKNVKHGTERDVKRDTSPFSLRYNL